MISSWRRVCGVVGEGVGGEEETGDISTNRSDRSEFRASVSRPLEDDV